MSDTQTTAGIQIHVYICPDCSNYFGSSSMPDLAKCENIRSSMRNLAEEPPENWGSVTGTRDECPDCAARGKKVRRRLVELWAPA